MQETYYLDRFDVTCENDEAMTGWQLKGAGNSNYYYEYECCSLTPYSGYPEEELDTGWANAGGGKLQVIIKLHLSLAARFPVPRLLLALSLTRPTPSLPLLVSLPSIPPFLAQYLDRHNIECPLNSALHRFKLERNNADVKYDFTCIKLPSTVRCRLRGICQLPPLFSR